MAAQNLDIQIAATDKTSAAFRSVKSNIEGVASSASDLVGKIGLVTSALAAIGVGSSLRNLINTADKLDELSARTKIAASTLSALTNTAQTAGVGQDEFAGSIIRLNKSIAESLSGVNDQSQAFENLGISVKDSEGNIRPTVEILGDLADAFSGAGDNAIKTQYAMALFGKSGANLLEFLEKGRDGIQEFGATIDDDFAAQAASFNDSIDLMGKKTEGFLKEKLSPVLAFINRQFAEVERIAKIESVGAGRGFVNPVAPPVQNPERNLFKPIITKTPAKKTEKTEAEKELEKISQAYQQVSSQIEKLAFDEDKFLLIQFQRITNDETAIAQYEQLLASRRKLLNLDRELEEAGKTADKLSDDALKKRKEELENEKRLKEEAAKKNEEILSSAKRLYEETRTPLESFNIEMTRLDDLLAKGYISWDVYSRATLDALDSLDLFKEEGKDTFEDLKDAINGWGNEFTSVLTQATMTGKLSFSDLANSVIRDLIRMQIQSAITTPLVNMGKDFLGINVDGARAMGGPVTSGKSYLVGENGPEIFTPSGSGAITANNQIASGGVTVNQVINVSTGVQQTVRAEIMTLMPQIAGAAKAAVADAKMRGGGYAAAMR